jgi:hypothetical protein
MLDKNNNDIKGVFQELMAWEMGELSEVRTVRLFAKVIKEGLIRALPAKYVQMAEHLVQCDILTKNGDVPPEVETRLKELEADEAEAERIRAEHDILLDAAMAVEAENGVQFLFDVLDPDPEEDLGQPRLLVNLRRRRMVPVAKGGPMMVMELSCEDTGFMATMRPEVMRNALVKLLDKLDEKYPDSAPYKYVT